MGSNNINKNGKHWSDKNFFGSRALFTENSKPPSLALDDLQISDDGIYKCRVDFRLAQTSITRVKLTVIGEFVNNSNSIKKFDSRIIEIYRAHISSMP